MKISTFTVVAGSDACNAKCPYCVSKMTGKNLGMKLPEVNWRNFDKACLLAKTNFVSTVLFTGKGEPTLFPDQITEFLQHMKQYEFPIIEMQSNGLTFGREWKKYEKYLKEWYENGLSTISLSIAHYKKEKNKEIFTPDSEYIDLAEVISNLHKIGFSIRLSCILVKDFVDTLDEFKGLVDFCKENNVEQLTVRPVRKPESSEDKAVYNWTRDNEPTKDSITKIDDFIRKNGHKLMTFSYGAEVYDLFGQNVAISDCLTIKPETDEIRQLIFFPDGHLRYDWQYKGAILM